MGRYDKIKVYNNGEWVTPNICRVYNKGTWVDLGTAKSYMTRSLSVRSDGSFKRVTLNRVDREIVTDTWAQGGFQFLPESGFCYYPFSNNGEGYNWYFRATINKTKDIAQNIFYCGVGNNITPGDNYIRIVWNEDGTITVTSCCNGTSKSVTTTNAVLSKEEGPYPYLNIYANKGSYVLYIVFDGVTTTTTLDTVFKSENARNQIGDTYTEIRNTISAAGVNGKGYTYAVSFDASNVSGTDNAQFNNVRHSTKTETITEYV